LFLNISGFTKLLKFYIYLVISCSNNYRPIALATSISKIFEHAKIILNGRELRWVDTFTYLGFKITNSIKVFDDQEMCTRANDLRKRANMLSSKFGRMDFDVKRYLFSSYLNSIYCMALWTQSKSNMLHKVKVAYNDCIRLLFRFPTGVSVTKFCLSNTILDFNAVRRKVCYSLFRRVSLSDNLLVNKIKYNMFMNRDALLQTWFSILYTSTSSFVCVADFLNFTNL